MRQLDWDESPYFLDNWMQANWELLVEMQAVGAGMFLAPYGYSKSSECRYTHKNSTHTHIVRCKLKNELEFRYNVMCFLSRKNEEFKIEPPFDFVDVEDVHTLQRLCLAFTDLDFSVEKLI